jgi:hypothetical protein
MISIRISCTIAISILRIWAHKRISRKFAANHTQHRLWITQLEADPGNIIHGAQIHAIFSYTARTVTAAAVITALQPFLKRFQLLRCTLKNYDYSTSCL